MEDDGAGRPLRASVLDLSGSIGAYCSKLLSDLGAEVLLVEPPSGDGMRLRPPFAGGRETEDSLLFAAYHANKRGVTLDSTDPDALPLLEALGRHHDVILVSPTRRRPLVGFDRDAPSLRWAAPGAVVAAITPFGLSGPLRDLRATPFISFAMSGGMHRVGRQDGPPQAFPGALAWDEAGIHAAAGVVAALGVRQRYGGQMLDLSAHEVGATKDFLLERYDVAPLDEWGRYTMVGIPPTGIWQCADGPLAVAAHQEHHWAAFFAVLGEPPELSDPAFASALFRREAFDLMETLIGPLLRERSRWDLFERGQTQGLPCAPYNAPSDFIGDVQPECRGAFASQDGLTFPWRWCGEPSRLLSLRRAAPSLGEHNREVYVDLLGFSDSELAAWRERGLV